MCHGKSSESLWFVWHFRWLKKQQRCICCIRAIPQIENCIRQLGLKKKKRIKKLKYYFKAWEERPYCVLQGHRGLPWGYQWRSAGPPAVESIFLCCNLSSFVVIEKDVFRVKLRQLHLQKVAALQQLWWTGVTGLDQVGRIHAYTICCSVKLPEGLWIKLSIALWGLRMHLLIFFFLLKPFERCLVTHMPSLLRSQGSLTDKLTRVTKWKHTLICFVILKQQNTSASVALTFY